MARYPNGRIPLDTLIRRRESDYATAGTWAKWDALVEDVRANEGITLQITPGNNVYRDYASQVYAREQACKRGRCDDASVPGKSTHGGVYNGRDALAIDVQNWSLLGQTKWYYYARKHGFEPGFFDWEPWHIIDWEPYRAVPSGGGSSSGGSTAPAEDIGEEDMYVRAITAGSWARKGYIYSNDMSGHWRGLTNLEGDGIVGVLAREGRVRIVELNGPDIDLLFAVNGVWEQQDVNPSTAPRWGSGTKLDGLGALTGKIRYPGQPGGWHYPISQDPA